ncbi:MAG: gamma-glutamyltransferase family protein [Acidobacteriia bacterium]|nr:gamma-glutamyltransferase family protein [Terriglobia bacterium]
MINDSAAKDRSQARSMVITQGGVIATSQTLASQAGAQTLARGGSCIDAAIAANAVLSVVEPMMCGLGGDLFAIYRDAKTGELTGINASGYAPKALTLEKLNYAVPAAGIHSATVPGGVDGWAKLHARFGKLPWADLFQPAIYYAERGFPLTELIQYDWEHEQAKLYEGLFLRNGHAPHVGEIFRNPELASAYRILAREGRSALYEGELARAILQTSERLGGTMSAEDLREFEAEWIEPISTVYRDWRIYQIPPNGQGIGTLEMLNIMENFDFPSMDPLSADAYHLKIEAQKLAFADQRRYIADPRFADVPVAKMLSKEYAKEHAATIGHTIYLAAADREGNTVSFIQSISDLWGSGVIVDGFGFHLHNRGSAFAADPKHPNALEPRKRPYHTIIPGFMQRDSYHIAFGIMRGLNQAQAHAQFVSNVVDHGMNIQAALEAPRFTKMTLGGSDVRIEGRVPAPMIAELRRRGHEVEVLGDYSGLVGGGQAVMRDSSSGVNYGASSPRKDGAAIPEPERYWG